MNRCFFFSLLKVVFVLSFVASVPVLHAQNADERVGALLNASDYMTLRVEYPQLRDSMQVEFLKLLADGLLANKSNRYLQGSQALETLLREHSGELGEAVWGLTAHLIMSYGSQGRYAEASALTVECIQRLKTSASDADMSAFMLLKNLYSGLVGIPAPSLSRPDTVVSVPCLIDPIVRKDTVRMSTAKYQLKVPLFIHGKEHLFVFDTGAGMTMISDKLARETGVTILGDSVVLGGVDGHSFVSRGMIDTLEIGGVKLYHQPVLIRQTEAIDSMIELDAVLGIDIMKQLGVISVDIAKKQLFIGSQSADLQGALRMLIDQGEQLTIRLLDATERPLDMLVDTGRSDTELYARYYDRHKAIIDAQSRVSERTIGGIGGVKKYSVRVLPDFHLKLGEGLCSLTDVDVHTRVKNGDGMMDGALGLDVWRRSQQVTLDFIGMTILFK